MDFKAPNTDTLTAEKLELTNQKLIDYLNQSQNQEAAKYVQFLTKNLNKDKKNTDTSKYDKLLYVNQKILKVLEKIEKNMIDEQDTSIKHPSKFFELFSGSGVEKSLQALMDLNTSSSSSDLDLGYFQRSKKPKPLKTPKTGKKTKKPKPKKSSKSKKSSKDKDTKSTKKTSTSDVKKPSPNDTKPKPKPKDAVQSAKEAANKTKVPKEPKFNPSQFTKGGAKTGLKSFSKLAGPAAVAVDAAFTAIDYVNADSDAERTEALAAGAASTAGGIAGAVALSWIPVLGPIAGYALGSWIGGKFGGNLARLFTDPEDEIPDEVTSMGPEAELEYLNNILIPLYQNSPDIKESDKQEALRSLNKYKSELQSRIARGFTQEEKDDFTMAKLETNGVFEKNLFGDSEILDWDKVQKCSIKDLDLLINYDDWDDDTLDKLKQVKLLKENQQSEKESSTTSSIDSINKAIQAEKEKLQKAVESQDTLEVQKIQSTLEALDEAKQTAMASKNDTKKTIETKQSALQPSKKIASTSSKSNFDINNQVREAELKRQKDEAQRLKALAGFGPLALGSALNYQTPENRAISEAAMQAISEIKPSGKKFNPDADLGVLSSTYESNGDPGCISSGAKDAGGKSYGAWQIASKTGTLMEYINFAKDTYPELTTASPASVDFDAIWKAIAQKDPQGFLQNQYEFIKKTHFDPVLQYARSRGLDTSNRAVLSALWSQSVQHGYEGNKKIIDNTLAAISGSKDPETIIRALYSARSKYVSGLDMDPDTKASVLNRYVNETSDAIAMNNQIQTGVLGNEVPGLTEGTESVSSSSSESSSVESVESVESSPTVIPETPDEPVKPKKGDTEDRIEEEEKNREKADKLIDVIKKVDIEIGENYKLLNKFKGTTNELKLKKNIVGLLDLRSKLSDNLAQLGYKGNLPKFEDYASKYEVNTPEVNKSNSEVAIENISNNLSNNTVNNLSSTTVVNVNNQTPQGNSTPQRKDNMTEPNLCESAFNNNL